MITESQWQLRKTGIGSSDSPIIMGFSSYKTPYQLYLEKVGVIEEDFNPPTNGPLYWGNILESVIADEYTRRTLNAVAFPDTMRSEKYPFMLANLDGFVPSLNAVLELKCSGSYQASEWGEDGSDEFPMHYLIQVAHQCIVAKADHGILAVLIGGNDYRQYRYERDAELEKLIIDACAEFWDCVQNRREPEPITIQDCRLKYRESRESAMQADYSTQDAISGILAAKETLKRVDGNMRGLMMEVMQYMGEHEALVDVEGQVLATWKTTKKGNRVFLVKEEK